MGLRLKEESKDDDLVLFRDMKPGAIGIIVGDYYGYEGKCVIKTNDTVVNLDGGGLWCMLDKTTLKVKILPKGTEFIIN